MLDMPSMGPQLVRCGKKPPGVPVLGGAFPSMGPQLVRCGKFGSSVGLYPAPPPSMGPQLVRCGKTAPCLRGCQPSAPFNGAATCSLRKVSIDRKHMIHQLDLQWGRNLFVAESPGGGPPNMLTYLFLQWGRNLFVAESATGHAVLPEVFVPSMGPQLVRCGKHPSIGSSEGSHSPSMGPQLVRCGKYASQLKWAPIFVLQWGRNLFVAESRIPESAPRPPLILQWGRNLFVAESSHADGSVPRSGSPSMGPQLVRCGKWLKPHH